jgi:hypothetical protein
MNVFMTVLDFGKIVSEKEMGLFEGVARFRHRKATDLRDKIYGVVGLSQTPIDSVNYDISTAECYTTFAVRSITETGKLGIFTHLYNVEKRYHKTNGMNTKRMPNLPSWVPDWSLDFRSPAQNKFAARLQATRLYRASKETKAVIRFTQPDKLRLQGIIFDTVSAVGEAHDDARVLVHEDKIKGWAKLAEVLIFHQTNDMSSEHLTLMDEMFRRTLSCDITAKESHEMETENGEREGQQFKRTDNVRDRVIFDMWQHSNSEADEPLWVAKVTDQAHLDKIVQSISAMEVQRYQSTISQMTIGRRFIRTTGGRMGFAPKKTQVGDRICIICGGDTPYIIRPIRSFYRLLGDAYVSGVMDGEIIDRVLELRLWEYSIYQWIQLR